MHQWARDEAPEQGSLKAVRVLRIGFATNLLSTALVDSTKKEVIRVAPAPAGGSTVVDLMFTRESEGTLSALLVGEPSAFAHRLLAYHPLPSGEAVCIAVWFAPSGDETFTMPADAAHPDDLIISPADPMGTGRPLRLTLYSNPKDGGFIQAWEFGAYWRPHA